VRTPALGRTSPNKPPNEKKQGHIKCNTIILHQTGRGVGRKKSCLDSFSALNDAEALRGRRDFVTATGSISSLQYLKLDTTSMQSKGTVRHTMYITTGSISSLQY
jgi:hypothetical protein